MEFLSDILFKVFAVSGDRQYKSVSLTPCLNVRHCQARFGLGGRGGGEGSNTGGKCPSLKS